MSDQSPKPPKKQNVSQEDAIDAFNPEDWSFRQCLICHDVVVDAVLMGCCGGLYCRRCVLLWLQEKTTCPSCRQHGTPDNVSTDVRSERLAANVLRPCAQAHLGCVFKGNRRDANEHAWRCDFISKEALALEICRCQESLKSISSQFMKAVQAAFGPQPALDAIKVLHKLEPTEVILQIKRTRRTSLHCCRLTYAGSEVALEMRQSRNISMCLRNIGNAHAMFDMKIMLLHPKDTLCSVKLSFSGIITDSVQLTNSEGLEMNWSTESFDNYCSNGHFFISIAGRLVSEN